MPLWIKTTDEFLTWTFRQRSSNHLLAPRSLLLLSAEQKSEGGKYGRDYLKVNVQKKIYNIIYDLEFLEASGKHAKIDDRFEISRITLMKT